MTVQLPPSLERVARANPAPADNELGRGAVAQETLGRILATERPAVRREPRPRPRRHGRRLAVVLIAAVLLAVGGALAATDPFGLFRSPNPGSAIYAVDPSRHVTPPTVQHIGCPSTAAQTFACAAPLGGQRYALIDHVSSNPPITRAGMLAAIRRERQAGQLSAAAARRLDADIAGISDEFIASFNLMMRFGTYSAGLASGDKPLVPPPGVPSLLVCETAGATLHCRDMNGDDSAPVGGGIYAAQPAPDWRPAPPQRPDPGWPLEVAILGHPPTAAELRFEMDLVRYGTTSTAAVQKASPAPAHRAQRATRR